MLPPPSMLVAAPLDPLGVDPEPAPDPNAESCVLAPGVLHATPSISVPSVEAQLRAAIEDEFPERLVQIQSIGWLDDLPQRLETFSSADRSTYSTTSDLCGAVWLNESYLRSTLS